MDIHPLRKVQRSAALRRMVYKIDAPEVREVAPRNWTRRDFLKQSVALGAAAAVGGCGTDRPNCEPSSSLGDTEEQAGVLIIGSGFGGAGGGCAGGRDAE